ncbi:hypothetical protein CSKR_201606 [Clonorchis sinensis]|uniref:Uncharacterized protein n=1 Tax=Clonorchis sinensis TaxID=79923 RepID=A0A8T1MS08_CLOSI|nr:hypothetical protein CSKR_201606 [Clonorchis sinensis]
MRDLFIFFRLSYVSCFECCPHWTCSAQCIVVDSSPDNPHFLCSLMERLMETGEPSGWVRQLPPAAMKEPLGAKNGNMCPYSSTDESEILHRNIFPLQSQRLPRDSLKFILTVWYSPETSSAIAESISTCCSEVQLKKLITGSPRDVLRLAEKYFEELDI